MRRSLILALVTVALAAAVTLDRWRLADAVVLATAGRPADAGAVQVGAAAVVAPAFAAFPVALRDPFHPAGTAATPARAAKPRAPAPPAATVEAPRPVPPPLPYQYLGAVKDAAGRSISYVATESSMHPIRVGAVLDGVWRIDIVEPSRVVFTYLPLDLQQTISVAAQ